MDGNNDDEYEWEKMVVVTRGGWKIICSFEIDTYVLSAEWFNCSNILSNRGS